MPFRILFLSLLLAGSLCAQQYRMDHFGIKDGLSQNTVNCILKDSEGYYWFGTQDGLNRYDGYTVKVFRNERGDSASLSDNFVLSIAEDDWGNLWVGTRNGLNHYNKKTNVFTRVWSDQKERTDFHCTTKSLLKDGYGNILFRSARLPFGRIEHADAKEPPFSITADVGKTFFTMHDAGYALGSAKDSMCRLFTVRGGQLWEGKLPVAGRLSLAASGKKVFMDHGTGIFLLEHEKLKEVFPGTKGKRVTTLFCDSRKNLWIGTTDGLYVSRNAEEEPILLAHNDEDSYSLSSSAIESIYEDPDGLMWFGTSEGGVNIYDPQKEVFGFLHHGTNVSISSNPVWGIQQSGNELLIGTGGGLNKLQLENPYIDLKKNISVEVWEENKTLDKFITCVTRDKENNIWLGTRNQGVVVYEVAKKSWSYLNKSNSSIRSGTVDHIFCDGDGEMWISTQAGLYRYFPKTKEILSYFPDPVNKTGIPSGYVISTYQDKKGVIWISSTGGITRYDKADKKFKNYTSIPGDTTSLGYNMATSSFEDTKGRFWVSTLGGGFCLMDREKGTFRSFTKRQGLANDVVYGALEDGKGFLWICTNGGLSRFDPDNFTCINYTIKDGILSNEFTQNAFFKNEAGQLLFGTPHGMLFFHPDSIRYAEKTIPIMLTGLKINYKDVTPGKEIDLLYEDKTIAFEFAAGDMRLQDKIRYAFKLEGFDAQWNETAPSARIASYSSLPFGDYIFKVRVRAGSGSWQEEQFAISLHVIAPFWMRPWFIVLEVLFGFALLAAVVKYYAQRKLKEKLREAEIQHKLQLERERISRDLHDHVGSNLTYIISSLDNLNDRVEKLPVGQTQVKIESLGEFTRSTMQQLRETIWVINKESVSVNEFKEKIREHLSKMLGSNGAMEFSLVASGNAEILLKPSLAIHLFRIVQEAVNNSIKHSSATDLSVDIHCEGGAISVMIKDNGKGFNCGEAFSGHYGLVNMRARAEEIGGELILDSALNRGTLVKLVIPV